ncbi:glycosyltransferase [Mycolicibacterium elephantis]
MAGCIVHEWMSAHGGSEKVFEAMTRAFPDADLFTLWRDAGAIMAAQHINESWLSRTPLRRSRALALPLMSPTWRTLGSKQTYDWILVSSHLFAHHTQFRGPSRGVPKLVYTHTPARYIWAPELDHRGDNGVVRVASMYYRKLDKKRATEPVSIAANSEFVRDRIRRSWGRDATVIYPPVPITAIAESARTGRGLSESELRVLDRLSTPFLLGASRFVSYKELDKVIAVGSLLELPVVLAGRGPQEAQLREMAARASIPVDIIIAPSDVMLHALFLRCAAYIFPAVEDFGIMPVEAMAAGAPVVVNHTGGAKESARFSTAAAVTDFGDLRTAADAIRKIIDRGVRPTPDEIDIFDEARFTERIRAWVTKECDRYRVDNRI